MAMGIWYRGPSKTRERSTKTVLVGGGSKFFNGMRKDRGDGMSNEEEERALKIINRVSGAKHDAIRAH